MKKIVILVSMLINISIPSIYAQQPSTNPMDAISRKDRKEILSRIREIQGAYEQGAAWFGSAERGNLHIQHQNNAIETILKKYHIEVPQQITWKWLNNLQQECKKIKYESTAISLEKFAKDGKCSYCTLE